MHIARGLFLDYTPQRLALPRSHGSRAFERVGTPQAKEMASSIALHVFLLCVQIGLITSNAQNTQDYKHRFTKVIFDNNVRHTRTHQENSTEESKTAFLSRAGKAFRLKNDDTESPRDHSTASRDHVRARECQRADLVVDLRDLGWDDWILAPFLVNVKKCVGVCALSLQNATNHAIVQAAAHALRPSEPGPSCVPTKLAPLAALYIDSSGKLLLKNFQNMVVTECGCR